jgi:hypothetical protein
LNSARIDGRSTPLYAGPTPSRPMTSRAPSRQSSSTTTTSNFYYQLPGGTKGPLPAELISKRSTNSLKPNEVLPNRVSSRNGSLIIQQPTTSIRNEIKSIDTVNTHVSTPLRVPAKSLDGLHQVNGFDYDSVTIDEYPHKFKVKKKKKRILIYLLFYCLEI